MSEYSADSITVIEPTIAAVRLRPGLYFGSVRSKGVEQFVYELVANVLDSYLAGRATFVNVKLAGAKISVVDDGEGIPFDEPSEIAGVSIATKLFTHVHFTNSQGGHAPHVHMTATGIGLAPLNAASLNFTVRSWRNGAHWEQHFDRGIAQCDPTIIDRNDLSRGTRIELTPDPEIFGQSQPRVEVLRRHLFETAHLFGGLKVGFNEERFHAPKGLQMLGFMLLDPLDPLYPSSDPNIDRPNAQPFHIRLRVGDVFVEVAVFRENPWHSRWEKASSSRIFSWVNGSRTPEHGSHVEGLREALQIANLKSALSLIQVVMYDPQFAGPVRHKLEGQEIQRVVRDALQEPLCQYRSALNIPPNY
jgi:DNA gyrase subunit B